MARFGHRFGSIASVLALVGWMLLAPAPPVAAATCEVTNTRADTTHETLQEAVDDAASGDTLEVRGTCVGRTVIRTTRLRLKGIATTEQPTPTLDGAQLSRVLLVLSGKVVIRDLTITNGKARVGGGIFTRWIGARPRVTLSGDTSVTGNRAGREGGGISSYYGILTLNGSSSVTRNTAGVEGGGIYNDGGTVTLNGSASVTENTAKVGGGGISNSTYGSISVVYVCSDEVAISPNDPDDPPETLPCPS